MIPRTITQITDCTWFMMFGVVLCGGPLSRVLHVCTVSGLCPKHRFLKQIFIPPLYTLKTPLHHASLGLLFLYLNLFLAIQNSKFNLLYNAKRIKTGYLIFQQERDVDFEFNPWMLSTTIMIVIFNPCLTVINRLNHSY